MQFSTHKVIFLSVVLGAGSVAYGQTTQPADVEIGSLTVAVWTCEQHEKFRMSAKGACPVCRADLVRKDVTIQDAQTAGSAYTLTTCPVSGQELGSMGAPIVMMHEGREVRFCSAGCIKRFEADAPKYLKQIDARIIEHQVPYYPLTSCPISGQPLGSMGEPINFVHNNRLVRFCCNGCVRGFKKNPAPTLAKLNQAVIARQKDDYPLKTCMISKMELGSMGQPVDYIAANRLIRFCCSGCVSAFYKTPATYLAKLNEAWSDHETQSSNR